MAKVDVFSATCVDATCMDATSVSFCDPEQSIFGIGSSLVLLTIAAKPAKHFHCLRLRSQGYMQFKMS